MRLQSRHILYLLPAYYYIFVNVVACRLCVIILKLLKINFEIIIF